MKRLEYTGCPKKFDIILQANDLGIFTECIETDQDFIFNGRGDSACLSQRDSVREMDRTCWRLRHFLDEMVTMVTKPVPTRFLFMEICEGTGLILMNLNM